MTHGASGLDVQHLKTESATAGLQPDIPATRHSAGKQAADVQIASSSFTVP